MLRAQLCKLIPRLPQRLLSELSPEFINYREIFAMDRDIILESKRVQLETLQNRIGLHGSRMWQLPLTYLGAIALALTAYSSDTGISIRSLFNALSLLGVAFVFCFYGAHEGYRRTAQTMQNLEKALEIEQTTKAHWSHTVPYFILLIIGIASCVYASLKA